MKNKIKFGLVLMSILFFQCRKEFNSEDIKGIYVNKNYEYSPFLPDIPYEKDTLILNDDLSFSSNFWGKGTYDIFNSVNDTKIKLKYKYEGGEANYSMSMYEDNEGVKINLYSNKNHHYLKIK